MDPATPRVEAFAVSGGRISAVGTAADIRRLAGRNTKVVDARSSTVFPGFIDAHCHPDGVEELVGVNCNLPRIADIQAALKKKAAETPPGMWVSGHMYDDTKLADGRPLTRRDIDAAVTDRSVLVVHRGGHTGIANSAAFAEAGVDANTPDPDGGRFYRENGELTGKVAEHALDRLRGAVKRADVTPEVRRRAVAAFSGQMAKSGLTSVHSTGADEFDLRALEEARDDDQLRFRMYLFPLQPLFRKLNAAGIKTGFGDEVIRIGPVKYIADGSASERTMRMSTPYVGRPNDYGILVINQEDLNAQVEEAHRAGWRVGTHANGDVAIDMVLKAYERAQQLMPRADVRHRIEHCTLVNPGLLERIKAGGVIPAPFYTYVYYHGEKWVEYGEEKVRWMFAHRSFLDYGIPVAPASDYMPGPYEPLMAIQSMVTRTDYRGRVWGGNQKITVPEALRICTMNGAYASKEEAIKGSITPGKLADFVVLARDPHTEDPSVIKDIPVLRTFLGGRPTFEA
jgi:predicted amidohydrolase YtcJ